MNPGYNGDLGPFESPNEMQLDSDEFNNEAETEKDVAVDISIEDAIPRADDFEAMKELVLPPLAEQPPIIETSVHTWEIEGWKELPVRARGPTFECGGYPWRVLLFPRGNNVDNASAYLEQGFPNSVAPDDWVCCVQFGLVLWNPNAPLIYQHHTAHHRFTKEEGDWGFTRFVELKKLWTVPWDESGRALAEGQKASMTAYVRVVKDETGVLWHNFANYDSKKETGYVGLKNQGATCYLNSLIQSLYFTNAFRKAVYQIPTSEGEPLTNSAYTLQRLFYQLQNSQIAVSTNELTKSFGWETRHIFEQQDVQELSRKLMEKMEEKMKGTEAESVLPRLFCGKVRTYISCINVEYESRRVEDFWDIQLNVSGNKNLEASFKDYIQVEVMNGENQYFAGEEFKLQDAKKGVIFESFPEVLHLQLKRFQYDVDRDAMMKINDRYEFPETFDAAPYLAENADRSESWIYQLHGVLVHSGDLNAGHYYAFIKPEADGWFYRYDDDKVTKATLREVLEDNFGGEYQYPPGANGLPPFRTKSKPVQRQNSAYMLVYIRQTRVDKVLLPVTGDDTPPHLQKNLDAEAALREAKRKEREEQHLYLGCKVITPASYRAHGGTDMTAFDLLPDLDPAAPRYYRQLRKSTVKELLEKIGEDIDVDPRLIRVWCMVNRQNKTIRPDIPISDVHISIEEVYQRIAGSRAPDLRLLAEVAEKTTPDGLPIWPATPGNHTGSPPRSDLIFLFLKFYDYQNKTLQGAGHIYISREKRVDDLPLIINRKMGWAEKQKLKLFEEIKPNMVEPLKPKMTLKVAEIQDGDIVCFQLDDTEYKAESKSLSALSDLKAVDNDAMSGIETTKSLSLGPVKLSSTKTTNLNDWSSMRSFDTSRNSNYSFPGPIEDARQYYEFLVFRKVVDFHPHPTRNAHPDDFKPFKLTLITKYTYDQVAQVVGEHLEVNPTHLRFWTVNSINGNPKSSVKRGLGQNLGTILNPSYNTYSSNNQRADSLYFEVLDMSLQELDTKRAIKVTWLSEGTSKEDTYDVLVPKNGNANDIVTGLIKKAKLEDEEQAGPIRLYEVHSSKIHRELGRDSVVQSITDYVSLIAERIPEEDITPPEDAEFIQAFHFHTDSSRTHGIPFQFLMIPGELFSETKKRLEKRTGIKGKAFEKIKFAVVKRSSYSKPVYLTDEMILDNVITADDDLLGLDHQDKSRPQRNGAVDLFLK